jgi:hypothetical protein
MMSGALSEDPGRPGPGAAAGTVFRSELNPVDFLYQAACPRIMLPTVLRIRDSTGPAASR